MNARSHGSTCEADMNSLLVSIVEKYRGRSIATFVNRWQRLTWDRRMEKATADAHRLIEEYKRSENTSRHGRQHDDGQW
jgi:hypothetical protein